MSKKIPKPLTARTLEAVTKKPGSADAVAKRLKVGAHAVSKALSHNKRKGLAHFTVDAASGEAVWRAGTPAKARAR